MIPGLQESVEQITDLIKEEAKTVPLDHIILGGISQGCATAVLTLLSSGLRLGGLVGLCSWLPFEKKIRQTPAGFSKDNNEISRHIQSILGTKSEADDLETSLACMSIQSVSKTPIFLAHARDDETVPFSMGVTLQKGIQDLGFDVVWKEYEDGGHWIHPTRGVDDITGFLHHVGI